MQPDDFNSSHAATVQARHNKITIGGKEIIK